MNIADLLILILIAAAVFFAVRTLRSGKDLKCGGGCAGCPVNCRIRKKSG